MPNSVTGGVLVANPIPETDELDPDASTPRSQRVAEAEATGVHGPGVTPVVLAAIAAATDGESVPANLALAENNARAGAEIAVAMAARS